MVKYNKAQLCECDKYIVATYTNDVQIKIKRQLEMATAQLKVLGNYFILPKENGGFQTSKPLFVIMLRKRMTDGTLNG